VLIANAGKQEEMPVVSFDLEEIRTFRIAESWRMEREMRLVPRLSEHRRDVSDNPGVAQDRHSGP